VNKREREEGSEKESEREWYGLLVAGRQQGGGGSGEGESEERERERKVVKNVSLPLILPLIYIQLK